VHDPELRTVLRALAERGQEIELFACPSAPEPDGGKPDADPEELQPEQHEDLRSDCERPGHRQEHEDDGGSEKAEKGCLPVFHLFAGLQFIGRLTGTRTCCYGAGEMQKPPLILIALAGLAALPAPAGALAQTSPAGVGTPDPCADEARLGGGAAGCFWNASINLGPMPQALYWHIDRFADVASAEAVRSLYGRVIVALGGQVFLQTVNDSPDWSSGGGERIATVGPLLVPEGPDLTARFMELTLPAGGGPGVLLPSGPQALILLDGALCIETPSGSQELEPRGSAIVPTGVPAAPTAQRSARALALVVHPSAANWIGAPSDWAPAGRCTP
jgi:hypothetical protein